MQIKADSPDHYTDQLPDVRKIVISRLRKVILENLPKGFKEEMNYGMIGYVVPHSIYPKGYHVDPKMPLPFMNLASQKNHIGVYHMCIYSDDKLLNWFKGEYAKNVNTKLDMGKSCIRFKNTKVIPYELIGELAGKVTVEQWINIYETSIGSR